MMTSFVNQIIGTRKEQQDSVKVLEKNGAAFAVLCDGMGGYAHGRECSSVACEKLSELFFANDFPVSNAEKLKTAVYETNSFVSEMYPNEIAGTTLVSVVLCNEKADWISVGDSRIYTFSKDKGLKQLNEDHTYGAKLDKAAALGLINEEIAQTHIQREAVTSFVGIDELEEISSGSFELSSCDAVVLCSDGVFKTISEQEIAELYNPSPKAWTEAVIKAVEAKHKPKQDNASIIILSAK